jgi:hypothetical protein
MYICNMQKLYLFTILISFILSSCATILNRQKQTIDFKYSSNIRILEIKQDSTIINHSSNTFFAYRSKYPIEFKYLNKTDTITRNLRPFLSNSYWWNIYFNYGLGMIIDNFDNKKYAYLKKFHITDDNLIVKEKTGNQNIYIGSEYSFLFSKNYVWATIIPYNVFVGYEYYYNYNQFISIEESLGLYLGGDKYNTTRNGYANLVSNLNIKNNCVFNNFEVGYGLCVHNSIYHNKLGMSFSGTNMLSNTFGIMFDINKYI